MTNLKPYLSREAERGNTAIIVLVALVVIAVGAIALLSGQIGGNAGEQTTQTASSEPASGQAPAAQQTADAAAADAAPLPEIKEGNPVVGVVNGQEITRADVFNFMQTLPQQTKQAVPPLDLFELALNQMLNERLIAEKAKGANLDDSPFVKERLEAAKQQLVRQAFIQQQIQQNMTDERLKGAYDVYVQNFPEIEEVKTRHILVEDEALAKDMIKQLGEGADFGELAKANSIDATKENGGELGFIAQQDQVIPEFLEAAFSQKVNEVSKKPVKSDFGFHVIEVLEKRNRPPASFEQAKPFLAAQISNDVLNDVINKWRDEAGVQAFDINGEPIEPAAGDETPEEAPAQ
ncbi:MAG: peptidylprolyl isomerase [Pseudomonadota bacterium]